jgi:hypothetical protein
MKSPQKLKQNKINSFFKPVSNQQIRELNMKRQFILDDEKRKKVRELKSIEQQEKLRLLEISFKNVIQLSTSLSRRR